MASFLEFIVSSLLSLLYWAIIISAIMSWLIAFDIINLRNQFVYNVHRFLDAVTRPILAPFQRIIPTLGGVDISPIIVLLIIVGIQRYLVPMAFAPLRAILELATAATFDPPPWSAADYAALPSESSAFVIRELARAAIVRDRAAVDEFVAWLRARDPIDLGGIVRLHIVP